MGKPCKRGHDGLRLMSGPCVQCGRDAAARRRAADPEGNRLALAAWYEKNKAYAIGRAAEWYAQNPERAAKNKRAWIDANPERKRAQSDAWAKANPEKVRASIKRWAEQNRPRVTEQSKARCAKRRARKRAAKGDLTLADIKEISRLQGGRCAACQAAVKLTIDHIRPLSRSGQHDKKNIQMLCLPCNSSKNAKDPIDFMQSRGFLL